MFGSWISSLNRICCPPEKKVLSILATRRQRRKGLMNGRLLSNLPWYLFLRDQSSPVTLFDSLTGHLLLSASHQKGPCQGDYAGCDEESPDQLDDKLGGRLR